MKFQRFMTPGEWQLNVGRFQINYYVSLRKPPFNGKTPAHIVFFGIRRDRGMTLRLWY